MDICYFFLMFVQSTMYSIAFNRSGDRLCCISDHGTLHLFALKFDRAIAPLPCVFSFWLYRVNY